MRIHPLFSLLFLVSTLPPAFAQSTVPTFRYTANNTAYTLLGHDPAQTGTTTIPTLLVPISLSFESRNMAGQPAQLDASSDVAHLLHSPVFSRAAFPNGGTTQFADALLRATFPNHPDWHTLFAQPEVNKTVSITVPSASGYLLSSKKAGTSLAVLDVQWLQRELFKRIGKQPGKLVIALTRNTTYYAEGDATICCSWGTHGADSSTGNSFVLASYLDNAPSIVQDRDIQPLTQQLAEFIYDPLHDPLLPERTAQKPGNQFPPWLRPSLVQPEDYGRCGGTRVGTPYFLLEPTDINPKNHFPWSLPATVRAGDLTYHIENVALLRWYLGDSKDLGSTNSFPNPQALAQPSQACPPRPSRAHNNAPAYPAPTARAIPQTHSPNGHQLIGYWVGYGSASLTFPLREISPQWDVILVAFAAPAKNGPEGTLEFHAPAGFTPEQFKSAVADLKKHGKTVMISLGGGGEFFSLADPSHIPNFVSSVARIVSDYGFEGIDLDFETPSLVLDPGDTDFRHPTTPSVVNLISGLRQLHDRFGPAFKISLVPEGPQIPAGYRTYGGQFGSYLPIAYGIRDILSFMDVQDYNTPPLEGLDGEIYQAGSVNYHAAMTDLVLHGFNVSGNPNQFFSPLPADKVAVGFLTGETTPSIADESMDYLITGKPPAGIMYKLRNPAGYPAMIGAMFWTIDADRRGNYKFSNVVGPELHAFPPNQ